MNKADQKIVNQILLQPLKAEDAAMLEKGAKNITSAESKMMVPLSKYNYWLQCAREEALEAIRYDRLINGCFTVSQRMDCEHGRDGCLALVKLYHGRAQSYYRDYQLELKALKASFKQNEEAVSEDDVEAASA